MHDDFVVGLAEPGAGATSGADDVERIGCPASVLLWVRAWRLDEPVHHDAEGAGYLSNGEDAWESATDWVSIFLIVPIDTSASWARRCWLQPRWTPCF